MGDVTMQKQALVLFAHGARDPRWAEPLQRIQTLVAAQAGSHIQVHQAFLELMKPGLPELMEQLIRDAVTRVTIVPIFLGQGAHVRSDLPKLVQEMEAAYPQVRFSLATAIGENELVLVAIANVCLTSLVKELPIIMDTIE